MPKVVKVTILAGVTVVKKKNLLTGKLERKIVPRKAYVRRQNSKK